MSTSRAILLIAATLIWSSTAHAKGPLDTLKRASRTTETSSEGTSKEDLTPGTTHALEYRADALTKTKDVSVETWLKPPSKWRYVSIREGVNCDRFVVVDHHSKSIIKTNVPSEAYILDIETGETFGEFNKPAEDEIFCVGDYMIVASDINTPVAFHMPTREVTKLHVELPDAEEVRHISWIKPIFKESGDVTELMVRVAGKERMQHGVWELPKDTLDLNSELPWHGISQARYVGEDLEMLGFERRTVETSTGFFSDDKAPTKRISTYSDDRVYVVDEAHITTTHAFSGTRKFLFLEEGYSAHLGADLPTIIHPDGEEQELTMEGCKRPAQVMARGYAPVSLLFGCLSTLEKPYQYTMAYWTPDGATTWEESSPHMLTTGWARYSVDGAERPIMPIQHEIWEVKGARHSSFTTWFDTRAGVTWEGHASQDISLTRDATTPTFLATDTFERPEDIDSSKEINLYKVDLNRGEETLLHTYTDCDGKLMSLQHHGDLFEVHCVTNPKPGRFQFIQQWSEVIDTKRGLRWRAPKNRFVAHIFSDGSFAISSMSKGANLVYPKNTRFWRGRFD